MTTNTDKTGAGEVGKTFTKAELDTAVQQAVSGATSRTQTENAALSKRVDELTTERDRAVAAKATTDSELVTLKQAEEFGDDVGRWAAYKATEEARIKSEQARLNEDAKTNQISRLTSEFDGLNPAVLATLPSAAEMEIYALRNGIKRSDAPLAATGENQQGQQQQQTQDLQSVNGNQAALSDQEQLKPQADRGGGNGSGPGLPANASPLDKIQAGLEARGDSPDADRA